MKKLPSIVFLSVAATCTISGYEIFAQSTLNYNEANIHFRNGQEYYESKSFEAARAEFELYLSEHRNFLDKNDPNQAWAKYFIVMCSLYLDRADTELLADRFVREYPEHPVASNLFREIGNYFFDNGEYGKAIDYLSKTAKTDEESQYHLGIAYYQTQSYAQALTVFTRLRDSQNQAYGLHRRTMQELFNFRIRIMRRLSAVLKLLKTLLSIKPKSPDGLLMPIIVKASITKCSIIQKEYFVKKDVSSMILPC
jgi:tetratricopeptide (TPR) repeat protein